jgi:precorrin-6A/cobalt-precorrin-6A reductase
MDEDGLAGLIRSRRIRAVVDATHPYAAAVSENAWRVCGRMKIPYLAYDRPGVVTDGPDIHRVGDHEEGASAAFSFGKSVLLTIGIRNLAPYVSAARKSEADLLARVLDTPESLSACQRAGLGPHEIVCATGPFSMAENFSLITQHHIGVLVTKDSGDAGGAGAKVTAARKAGCDIVVIERPERPRPGCSTISGLVTAIRSESMR